MLSAVCNLLTLNGWALCRSSSLGNFEPLTYHGSHLGLFQGKGILKGAHSHNTRQEWDPVHPSVHHTHSPPPAQLHRSHISHVKSVCLCMLGNGISSPEINPASPPRQNQTPLQNLPVASLSILLVPYSLFSHHESFKRSNVEKEDKIKALRSCWIGGRSCIVNEVVLMLERQRRLCDNAETIEADRLQAFELEILKHDVSIFACQVK